MLQIQGPLITLGQLESSSGGVSCHKLVATTLFPFCPFVFQEKGTSLCEMAVWFKAQLVELFSR